MFRLSTRLCTCRRCWTTVEIKTEKEIHCVLYQIFFYSHPSHHCLPKRHCKSPWTLRLRTSQFFDESWFQSVCPTSREKKTCSSKECCNNLERQRRDNECVRQKQRANFFITDPVLILTPPAELFQAWQYSFAMLCRVVRIMSVLGLVNEPAQLGVKK